MSIAQSAVEANIAATKALLGAKSVRELVDLQTEFSRSRFESLLAASAKLTELGLSLAGNTAAPIQAPLNATVETLVKQIGRASCRESMGKDGSLSVVPRESKNKSI